MNVIFTLEQMAYNIRMSGVLYFRYNLIGKVAGRSHHGHR
jgi:hypothetical protein